VPPGKSACNSTLPVVRMAAFATVFSSIDLSEVTLIVPPPGVVEMVL
jgi:hypothetical protein